MRWNKKENPKHCDHREVNKFSWLPTKVLCSDEVRWLEYVTIDQRYDAHFEEWENLHWVEIDGILL